jgi:hypothetical protein
MPVLVRISVILFLAAEVAIVAALGEDALWLAATWAIVAAGVAAVALLVGNATARVALAAALVGGCVVFAVELGLFFVPAAAALLGAAVADQRHTTPHHKQPLHAGR